MKTIRVARSALGSYEAIGDPTAADVVIGHSFGTVTSEGSANRALAGFILAHSKGRPVVVDRTLANAFPGGSQHVDHIVEGPVTNVRGQGVGTWGTLVEAKQFMDDEELSLALMVAQSHHIGRVIMQAEKLGIDSIVPPGLPSGFDLGSRQWWTKSKALWVPYEVLGSFVLRKQGKL